MAARDLIGKRGESIVVARLTNFCGNPEAYFDPHPLGEKCQTYDYLVELVNAGKGVPYFFVQVKATQKTLTKKERRLVVHVDVGDVRRMVRCPIPTYLVGVDEPGEEVYMVSIHGRMTGPITSIPSKHRLNCENMEKLWNEVNDYWQKLDPAAKTSIFTF